MKTLDEIAYDNGLELVSTTPEANGYPSHFKEALIGFESYEEAEALADAYDLSIEHFEKRDGWNIWYRTGNTADHDYELSAEDYGDNYTMFTKEDIASYEEDEINPYLSSFDNIVHVGRGRSKSKLLSDRQEFLNRQHEILDMMKQMDDDEAVLVNDGCYYATIKRHTMSYYEDVYTHTIGLIER